jgi:tripartite-type tricarboxylate transporter receptor subunit TctC
MFAPAATPQPVVSLLRTTVSDILRDPDFSSRVEKDGGRVLAIAPGEQAKFLREEIERWGTAVTRYGVGVD